MNRTGRWCAALRCHNHAYSIVLQVPDKLINERPLSRQNLFPGNGDAEIRNPVDFGEALLPARVWRPFHLEPIAGERTEGEINFEREAMYDLSAFLAQRCQRRERAFCDKAGLFDELAL